MTNASNEAQAASSQAGWVAILTVVTRPITLLALALLVTEGSLTTAGFRSGPSLQGTLLSIAAAVFVVVIVVVTFLTIKAPGALMGSEWLREPLAESLSEAIVDGLEGGVTNLATADDQCTAWAGLMLWIDRYQRQEGAAEREFRAFVVRGIKDRVFKRFPALKDAIQAELDAAA